MTMNYRPKRAAWLIGGVALYGLLMIPMLTLLSLPMATVWHGAGSGMGLALLLLILLALLLSAPLAWVLHRWVLGCDTREWGKFFITLSLTIPGLAACLVAGTLFATGVENFIYPPQYAPCACGEEEPGHYGLGIVPICLLMALGTAAGALLVWLAASGVIYLKRLFR